MISAKRNTGVVFPVIFPIFSFCFFFSISLLFLFQNKSSVKWAVWFVCVRYASHHCLARFALVGMISDHAESGRSRDRASLGYGFIRRASCEAFLSRGPRTSFELIRQCCGIISETIQENRKIKIFTSPAVVRHWWCSEHRPPFHHISHKQEYILKMTRFALILE